MNSNTSELRTLRYRNAVLTDQTVHYAEEYHKVLEQRNNLLKVLKSTRTLLYHCYCDVQTEQQVGIIDDVIQTVEKSDKHSQ